MSAIVGVIGADRRQLPTTDDVDAALLTMAHRGPTGQQVMAGEYFAFGASLHAAAASVGGGAIAKSVKPEAAASLGADAVARNAQFEAALCMDGTILNTDEIRDAVPPPLQDANLSPQTLALALYAKQGEAFAENLRGSACVAVVDESAGRAVLVRDRMGVKPLYYAFRDGQLVFASEAKAIVALVERAEVDREGLRNYLVFQHDVHGRTLFKGITSLPPGHMLTWDFRGGGTPSVRPYWTPSFQADPGLDEMRALERTRALIESAVRDSIERGGPAGCYISGGIDSSIVGCYAGRVRPDIEFLTFTGRYAEADDYDESAFAQAVADRIGSRHHVITPRADEFPDLLPEIVRLLDAPQGGPGVFGQYVVSREAAQTGVQVCLSGEGGDEVFLGYAKYLLAYLEECLRGAIYETADKARFVATLQSIMPNLPILREYVPTMQTFWSSGLFGPREQRYFSLCNRLRGVADILSQDVAHDIETYGFGRFTSMFESPECKSYINLMSRFDLFGGLQAVLQVDDRTSMGFGIENRTPLLDHRLVELIAATPPTVKFPGGRQKHLLREVGEGIVPEIVLARKDKRGFPLPIQEWFRGPLRDYVCGVLLDPRTERHGIFRRDALESVLRSDQPYSRTIWGALCLELWFQAFVD